MELFQNVLFHKNYCNMQKLNNLIINNNFCINMYSYKNYGFFLGFFFWGGGGAGWLKN